MVWGTAIHGTSCRASPEAVEEERGVGVKGKGILQLLLVLGAHLGHQLSEMCTVLTPVEDCQRPAVMLKAVSRIFAQGLVGKW